MNLFDDSLLLLLTILPFSDGEHECESGEVISDQWLCNGILDCSAGDDESECRKIYLMHLYIYTTIF